MQSEEIVINYFYIDTDNAKPIIKVKLQNYFVTSLSKECIIYKMSKSVLKHDIDNDEIKKNLNHAGIYFLLGKDKDTCKTNIYIGQAGLRKDGTGLARRIKDHDNKEEVFWDEFVIFTTSNNTLEKSDICYLEDKFTKLARKIPNNIVQNLADTNDGNINDEKKNYFERAYVQFILIVMDILGYKVFREEESQNINIQENALLSKDILLKKPISIPIFNDEIKLEENENCIFKFVGIKTINAKARWNNKEFIVLKGSQIRRDLTPSGEKDIRIKQLREKYKNEINENCILLNDIAFKSKSTAAEFVGGSAFNGNTAWIATNENFIQEIKNNELIQKTNDDEIIFLNFIRKDLHARCKRTDEGYWVLKDSQIKDKLTDAALKNETILNLRQKYKDKIDANWKLKDDCLFKSCSAAAKFVAGASYDGKIVWISDDGKLLENIIKEKGWNK